MAERIDGTRIAARLLDGLRDNVATFAQSTGITPGLAVVLVGDDPASQVYVRRKTEQTRAIGMRSIEHRLPADTSEQALLTLVEALNRDDDVDGILVQLPLPPQINAARVLDAISPRKDVDGFHPINIGRLTAGTGNGLVPCTPLGCMKLLDTVIDDYAGLDAVVVGKSNIVGKPAALLLLERGCTVSIAHSKTRNLPELTRKADILLVAVGRAGLVRGGWIKPGAVVIDVGINRIIDANGKPRLVGDVVIAEAAHSAAITPVPGGVGPMTIACLLANTLQAARQSRGADLAPGQKSSGSPT